MLPYPTGLAGVPGSVADRNGPAHTGAPITRDCTVTMPRIWLTYPDGGTITTICLLTKTLWAETFSIVRQSILSVGAGTGRGRRLRISYKILHAPMQNKTEVNQMNANENTQAQVPAEQEQEQQTTQLAAPLSASNVDQFAITAGNASPVYCTLDTSTAAGKKQLYKIKNRPTHNISDYINKQIRIKDIYIDVNARMNKDGENAGVIENKPRTILIDDKGESYIAGVSIGIYQAVKEIIRTFGDPSTWDEPLTVTVVQVKTAKGNMLSLDIV